MLSNSQKKSIVIRSQVDSVKNYQDYREQLRFDFLYSCAYCSITEMEALGIGFEIDHYLPQNNCPELQNEYKNLMWSCEICNRYKGGYCPDENDKSKGNVVLKPDEEDPGDHLELLELRFIGKTQTGKFNIELLWLNRLALRRLRKIRNDFWDGNEYIAHGLRGLMSIKIDKLSPKKRFKFLKIKNEIFEKAKSFDDLLRELAKSPFLDPDPEHKKQITERKKYLKQQRAIMGNVIT